MLLRLGEGGDLRSIGVSGAVAAAVDGQEKFDLLFLCLFSPDRKTVMRAADAVEKVSLTRPHFIQKHAHELLLLCQSAHHIELKWHLALLLARVHWHGDDLQTARKWLERWAADASESKIVRVNALQSLNDLLEQDASEKPQFLKLLEKIETEKLPSLKARIRKLKKKNA